MGKQNFGAMLDTQLPDELERHLRDILVIKPVMLSPEDVVRAESRLNWKRELEDI